MLRAFGYPVAKCCDMLDVVGSNLKMAKFFMQHLWMLHDVSVVWSGSRNNVALGHAHYSSSIFNSQLVATYCNRVPKRVQHVALNKVAICCVQMLRSFGWSLQMLGQQYWDMLRCDVAIVWPGLKNFGATSKRYTVNILYYTLILFSDFFCPKLKSSKFFFQLCNKIILNLSEGYLTSS